MNEILAIARGRGINLEAHGERLIVDAPAGAVTPALRAELLEHKIELLQFLIPKREFITLKGGLTLPLEAMQLAWSLEDRGFQLATDVLHRLVITPAAALTEADHQRIRRWRDHLGAIAEYRCEPM
jgi:hypothetical protein